MAPFTLAPLAGSAGYVLIFLLLGMGFGAVLEMSGFGDSRRLSAQFYLRDMTVLKVMFTGIAVAAVLVHLAASFQWLDLSRVWINPTYLVPGIVGGLIMGVGFIVGGFCPGTSLVAASTLKLDGVMFVLGGLFGALAFGETVAGFDAWWHSTAWGRLTIQDALHVPAGAVVLVLVVVALGAFLFAEQVERARAPEPGTPRAAALSYGTTSLRSRGGWVFMAALLTLAVVVAAHGQPRVQDRWRWIEPRLGPQLAERGVFVDPAEVVTLQRDLTLTVRILEVRSESDYNLFHLQGSRRIALADTESPALVRDLTSVPDNTIVFLVDNGEVEAVEAWKRLKAQGVVNLYVVEGGIRRWLERYPPDPRWARALPGAPAGTLGHAFSVALGDQCPSAHPATYDPAGAHAGHGAHEPAAWFDGSRVLEHAHEKKVKLQRKVVAKGGCG